MNYLFSIFIGYIIGSFNNACLISSFKQCDIRQMGTTNAGATNVGYVLGAKIGLLVAFLDVLKAIIAIVITRILFPTTLYSDLISGVSCVIGHIYPVFMNFKGGKGLSPLCGMIIAINAKFFVLLFMIMAILVYTTHYGISAALSALTLFPLHILNSYDITAFCISLVASLLMFYKHIPNLKRIANGSEVRFFTESMHKII